METTRPSLLIRVRNQRDQDAWHEFDAIYRPMLRRFARVRGLDDGAADEVAQECMVAVSRYIGGFEYDPQKGRFKGWLRTLVNNRIRNMLRDRHEVQAESQDFKRPEHQGRTPEEIFDAIWKQEHLKQCLRFVKREVESSTFDAFVAYAMEERSIEDVCEAFKMTANQVHAIKSRMIKRIRHRMVEITGAEE
ncbi:MAG: sigma-70 family RNA polymerase sigma factor [Planctomycetota bacterium]